MKSANDNNQISAIFARTGHSVWHHDWKIIVGVGVLFVLKAAWDGWRCATPRRRSRRY